MENWIIFTFLYAIFNGIFQCAKKKSIEKNTIYELCEGKIISRPRKVTYISYIEENINSLEKIKLTFL